MLKIKHERTADCVVAGYRTHKSGDDAIGSLLLGLLRRGRAAAERRRHRRVPDGAAQGAVRGAAAPGHGLRAPPVGVGRPGDGQPHPDQRCHLPLERRQGPVLHAAASRAGGRGQVRPHGGHPVPAHGAVRALARRPHPESCTYDQLEEPVSFDLADVLGGRTDATERRMEPRRPRPARRPSRERSPRARSLAAGALSTVGAASYFARRVLTPDRQRPDDTQILAVDGDSVTLGVSPDTSPPGATASGSTATAAMPGSVRCSSSTRGRVGCDASCSASTSGTCAGGFGRWNQYYFATPPDRSLGLRTEYVDVATELGTMPAWVVPAPASPTAGRSSCTGAAPGARRGCARCAPCTTPAST